MRTTIRIFSVALLVLLAHRASAQTTVSPQSIVCPAFPCDAVMLWDPAVTDVAHPDAAEGYRVKLNGQKYGGDITPGSANTTGITFLSAGSYSVSIRSFNATKGIESAEVVVTVNASVVVTNPTGVNPPTAVVIKVGVPATGTTTAPFTDPSGNRWDLITADGPTKNDVNCNDTRVGGPATGLMLASGKVYALGAPGNPGAGHWWLASGCVSPSWTDVGTETPRE